MLTILEAATLAGVSKDKCRYWLKLLDLEMVKQDGKLFLPDHAADLLKVMKNSVDSGLSPVAAAQDVKNIHVLPTVQEVHQGNQKNDIVLDKLEALEKSVLLLADSNRKLSEDNSKLAALILSQNEKINNLAAKLLPAPESKPINVWQPAKKTEVKVPLWRRLWLELVNPAALRATP